MRYFLIVTVLISGLFANCNLDNKSKSIVFSAAKNGDIKTLKKFISKDKNINCAKKPK